MQVTADETFTAVHRCQLISVEKGATIEGDIAAYLLRTGAAVTPADDDAQRVAEGEEDETPETPELDEEPEVASDLDITGTIDQVLAWVGDSPEKALQAHQAEEERGDKARSTLLAKLAEIGLS